MKKILVFVGMMFAVSAAHAAGGASASNIGVLESSVTVNTVAVSSFSPTNITPASVVMPNRTVLTLQNLDADNAIYCSDKANMTTSSNSFMLVAGGGTISLNIRAWSVKKHAITIYCMTAKTSGTSNLAVIQAY